MSENTIGRSIRLYFPFPKTLRALFDLLPYYMSDIQVLQHIWDLMVIRHVREHYLVENLMDQIYENLFTNADATLTEEGETHLESWEKIDEEVTNVVQSIMEYSETLDEYLGLRYHPSIDLIISHECYILEISPDENVFSVVVETDSENTNKEELEDAFCYQNQYQRRTQIDLRRNRSSPSRVRFLC